MTVPTLTRITVPARPDEAPRAMPGDELSAVGTAFGASPSGAAAVVVGAAGTPGLPATVVAWSDRAIRFVFPPLTGPVEVRVRTAGGTSAAVAVAQEALPTLPPAPVALLPLGLQTRFMAGGKELWVRVLPDTVHIDSHDEQLTAEEAELGRRYRDATGVDGPTRADVWLDLTTRFGAPRAEWIVRVTLTGTPVIRTETWARAARTRLLPRRLRAFAYDDAGAVIAQQHGRPIPFELPVGPDLGVSADADPATDPGMSWLIDFGQALAVGMAMKLTLPDPAPTRIARLVVVGVETSLTAAQGAAEFGTALAAHRYTRGVGFLPDGTPTNATSATPAEPEGATQPADQPLPPVAGGNADVTARALGLAGRVAELFGGTPHADDGGPVRSARRQVNSALWPATFGYFLEHLFTSVVPDDAIEPARRHFVDWVRGSGPQPVLRLGEQPYGLLPVLPMAHWTAAGEEPPVAALAGFLRDELLPVWRVSVAAVPRVDDQPPAEADGDRDNPLLTVLSLQPTATSFRGRSVLDLSFVDLAWRFIRDRLTVDELLGPAWRAEQTALARAALEEHGLGGAHPNAERTVFAANYFPVPFPLVQSAGPRNQPPATDWLSLLATAPWRDLRQDAFDLDERSLLYLLLRHSLLVSYLFAAGDMAPADPWRGGEPVLYGIDEIDDNLNAPRPAMVWDRLAAASVTGQPKGDVLDIAPQGPLAEVRASIAALAGTPVEVLEQATAETVDLCSHRLDAWITSYAQRRLQSVRGASAAGGLHLGAYGVVEDIRRGSGGSSAGYVHTPSLSHATAAAILAGGHRSHPDSGGTRQPFGIDLSSQRVRVALSLLDGVRAGQTLGALLGYRFERMLQERGLARFIDDFRAVSPLPVTGTASAGGAVEAIGARDVVDALELHRVWVAAGRTTPADWPGQGAQAPLQAVLEELDDSVDALGDILLTEGVYQLGRGNAERAAAALRAAAQPAGSLPDLEAIDTPHSGAAVTHRLTVLLPGDAGPASEWDTDGDHRPRRRAAAEPRLDAMAGQWLGDPRRIRYRVRYLDPDDGHLLDEDERRLDQLRPELCPLDVVYAAVANESTGLSELEQRIVYDAVRTRPNNVPLGATVRVVGDRPADDRLGLLEVAELARAIRESCTAARPVTPDDLALPTGTGTAAVDLPELEGRAVAADTALRAADTALGLAVATPVSEPLRAALLAALAFGVPGAVPLSAFGDTAADRSDLSTQGKVVQAELRRRIDALNRLTSPEATDTVGRVEYALARLRAVFGPGFVALPRYAAPPTNDPAQLDVGFRADDSLRDGDAFALTEWLQRLTRVHDGARRLGDLLLYADALGGADPVRLRVAQLPTVPGDRWLGLPFENGVPPKGVVSLVACQPLGRLNPNRTFAGLLVDQYTEVLPALAKTTGLALHYDQPNATPPQAIVLGVPPRPGVDWTLETLLATINDTLELAKVRMVDLDALQAAGHFLPATYLAFNAKGVTAATDFLTGRGAPLA